MKYLEPIQRGLRPWQAALQKISEIILWLQQSRLIAGHGISLIETGNGIVIHAENSNLPGGSAAAQNVAVPAIIKENVQNGYYLANIYANGLEDNPTQRDAYVFLPEVAYGSQIPRNTVVMVNSVYTEKYDVKAEKV